MNINSTYCFITTALLLAEQTKDQVDICTLSNDTGPCRAMKTRYYYNPKTGSCETFAYGGCQGNKNNFESLNDCQSKCKKGKPIYSILTHVPVPPNENQFIIYRIVQS